MSNSADGWVGVDLDGTLAHYDRWVGVEHIGEPIAPMVNRVKDMLNAKQRIKIFTARVCPQRDEDDRQKAIRAIKAWTLKIFGEELEVTHERISA